MASNQPNSQSKPSFCENLPADQIPFMQYGIINKMNFRDEFIAKVPIKRWDPLEMDYRINENYSNYSYIYGHYTYISPIRADRPMDRKKDIENEVEPIIDGKEAPFSGNAQSGNFCPLWKRPPIDIFEPQVWGAHYAQDGQEMPAYSIVIADGDKPLDNPFIDRARVYQNLTGTAFTMINKFPAMARVIDAELLPQMTESLIKSDINSKIAEGVCTVTIPRGYYTRLQDIPTAELADMTESMIAAIKYVIKIAQDSRNITAIPISPFFNVGKMVGGSLKRIHSQVYMDLVQDGHGSRIENILNAFEKMKKTGSCHLCRSSHSGDKRLVIQDENWTIFATGSPWRNYHLRFSPKEHITQIELLKRSLVLSLAKLLRIVFRAMDDAGVNPNRNILINTRPYGYNTDFHIFGDILPHEFVGGAEMADNMRVVRTSPVVIAEQLRTIIKERYLNDLN